MDRLLIEAYRLRVDAETAYLIDAFQALADTTERSNVALRKFGEELQQCEDEAVARLNQTQRAIFYARKRGGECSFDILADLERQR